MKYLILLGGIFLVALAATIIFIIVYYWGPKGKPPRS